MLKAQGRRNQGGKGTMGPWGPWGAIGKKGLYAFPIFGPDRSKTFFQ